MREEQKVLVLHVISGDREPNTSCDRLDCDLADILADLASRRFDPAKFRWKSGASVCVVMASEGYPGKIQSGKPISGLTSVEDNIGVKVLHAGTRLVGDVLVTSGGRVLGITAAAPTLESAVAAAYGAVNQIKFDGMQFRRDIGTQAGFAHSAGD